MDILLIMGAGIVIGAKCFPEKWKVFNEKMQILWTVLLIFCMGVTLGQRDHFIKEFTSLGLLSFVYFLLPSLFSLLLVYCFTSKWMQKDVKKAGQKAGERIAFSGMTMVFLALIALITGILWGLSRWNNAFLDFIVLQKNFLLYFLMFAVGISVGLSRGIIQKIREYHIKIFIIPVCIAAGSLAGGLLLSPFTGLALNESAAVASGMGWYSLSGVMLSELAGATVGSIAFLSNLMREIFSFFCIPWIARHMNYFSCIAPAGATSEDTTLPMMIRYTNEETVVLSVFNGIICSALVPVLIRLCF